MEMNVEFCILPKKGGPPMNLFRFLPLVLICSFAFADENLPVCGSEQALPGASCRGRDIGLDANQRVSVYLHPITLITSLAQEGMPLFLYITGEYPLSRFNSLIINPAIWAGGDGDFFRIGTGVGIRRFANGEANGLYLQAMPSIYYLNIIKEKGSMWDILGYIGYSAKYSGMSIFWDIGLGYGWLSINNDDNFVLKGLKLDINFGVGIPIL
jgi:hypothetical protein